MLPILMFSFFIGQISAEINQQCECHTPSNKSILFVCPSIIQVITRDALNNCSIDRTLISSVTISIDQHSPEHVIDLEKSLFNDFPNITHLNLSQIGLIGLKSGILSSLSKLSLIDLSHNKLQFIPVDVLKHLSLLNIDLNSNQIQFLNPFRDFNDSTSKAFPPVIKMFHNPVSCHCTNEHIFRTVKQFIFLSEFNETCPPNAAVHSCDSQEFNITTSHNFTGKFYQTVIMNCRVNGPEPYSVVWQSPNGSLYANKVYEPWVDHILISNRSVMIEPRDFYTFITVLKNHSIVIKHFRGFFYGEWKCLVFVPSGHNYSSSVYIEIESFLRINYVWSIIFGAATSVFLLLIGIIAGFVHLAHVTKCFTEEREKSNFRRPFFEVIPVPTEVDKDKKNFRTSRCTEEEYVAVPVDGDYDEDSELNVDVELVFKDEAMAREYVKAFDNLSQCSENPSAFRTNLEDIRSRLRHDVGPKLKIVRSRVRRATEDSRNKMHRQMEIIKNFNQESKDRMQRKMDAMKANRSEAANRMRAGFEQVKEHMKSVAELCGSVHLGQTISLVSVNSHDQEKICQPIKEYYFE